MHRLLFAVCCLAALGCTSGTPRVVLYCSQDREFAIDLLDDFKKESGLDVTPRFDTEANKSVTFYTEIVAEKDRPRCDVFWNNEIVSTLRLQKQSLLQSYESPAAKDYPAWARAKDHTWFAFAARARILIINTRLLAEKDRPRSLLDLTKPIYKGQVVMAHPKAGTTATQTACLFEVLGAGKAREFYKGLKENGLQVAPGNKQVAEWVARGRTPTGKVVAIGITDTDDAIAEVRAGRDVVIVFPDRELRRAGRPVPPGGMRMGTLFIPNTLCIPKGCPNPTGAHKLIDFLLGPDVERRLAEGPSAQIPLNPKVKAKLPEQIETPTTVQAMQVDWERARDLWDEAQQFVIREFGP
jgi:iron(III) transport system substrate-binding protein